jgi:hypothetical protein
MVSRGVSEMETAWVKVGGNKRGRERVVGEGIAKGDEGKRRRGRLGDLDE